VQLPSGHVLLLLLRPSVVRGGAVEHCCRRQACWLAKMGGTKIRRLIRRPGLQIW
jgi:hypothetical protein